MDSAHILPSKILAQSRHFAQKHLALSNEIWWELQTKDKHWTGWLTDCQGVIIIYFHLCHSWNGESFCGSMSGFLIFGHCWAVLSIKCPNWNLWVVKWYWTWDVCSSSFPCQLVFLKDYSKYNWILMSRSQKKPRFWSCGSISQFDFDNVNQTPSVLHWNYCMWYVVLFYPARWNPHKHPI